VQDRGEAGAGESGEGRREPMTCVAGAYAAAGRRCARGSFIPAGMEARTKFRADEISCAQHGSGNLRLLLGRVFSRLAAHDWVECTCLDSGNAGDEARRVWLEMTGMGTYLEGQPLCCT
jgi:hypothetical protein